MLARVTAFALDGLESRPVTVEVDIRAGLPAFAVVGLADKAVYEARERVRAAVLNSGFDFPQRRITSNLAPAYLRKVGPGFDLAIAVGLLAASGQVPADAVERWAVFGELSLGGELRPARGTLAVAEGARRLGLDGLVLPGERAAEAALVEGLRVVGAATLREVAEVLAGERPAPPQPTPSRAAAAPTDEADADLSDVRGHEEPIEALVIAAAGGHHLLMVGPPGTGKTMLARRLPGILPPLSRTEAIEVTRIQSVAGLHAGPALAAARPFRAPHHTISASGLVGGGAIPAPGEATLAHHGVLFLDELSEFARPALEALRQPLEDGQVIVVRGQRASRFPTRFTLVAATNPCPCGFLGDGERCRCAEPEIARYHRRLSGPLIDRVDLLVAVQRPSADELAGPPRSRSAVARERVRAARERQSRRFAGTGVACNARMTARLLREHVPLAPATEAALREAHERSALSARGRQRVLRVARTVADLDGAARVAPDHVLRALSLRQHEPGDAPDSRVGARAAA